MLPTISKKKIATTTGFTSNDKIVSTLYLQIVYIILTKRLQTNIDVRVLKLFNIRYTFTWR